MKKVVILLLVVSLSIFGKMPKEIEKKVYHYLNERIDNYSDRQTELDVQKNAYNYIGKLEKETSLSKGEFVVLRKGMEEVYPYDYVTQYKRLKEDLKIYEMTKKNLVEDAKEKIEKTRAENLEAKKNIENRKKEIKIPEKIYKKFKIAAEKRYPQNYIEQQKYLDHAVEIYKILN